MLSFTTTIEHIIFDESSLLETYSQEQLKRITTILEKKYKVWVLTNEVYSARNILQSLQLLPIEPIVTVFVTHDLTQIKYAQQQNISTILLTEKVRHIFTAESIYTMPDLVLNLLRFEGFMMHNISFGYRSEIEVEHYLKASGNGILHKPKGLLYASGLMQHKLNPSIQAELIIPGRFFTSGDTRAYSDVLTHYLLSLKHQRSFAVKVFSKSVKVCLDLMKEKQGFDVITVVPSRGSFNKLHAIFENEILESYQSHFRLNLLFVKESYTPQKFAGNSIDRARNIHNKIGIRNRTYGHVLLIDDIFTTGATTLECAKMLYSVGAESVTILPLAITQHKVKTKVRQPICDENGRPYRLKLNAVTGEPYWQSSGHEIISYQKIRSRYFEE